MLAPTNAQLVADALSRKQLVSTIVQQTMEEGVHYGRIPGTNSNALFQPGAQALLVAFGLVADCSDVDVTMHEDGHRDYSATCSIFNREGKLIGKATGECSTKETKYAYRNSEPTPTGEALPRAYWDVLKGSPDKGVAANPAKAQDMIGGPAFLAKKNEDGVWEIYKKGDKKVPHDNPADFYNTCRKMASKRALVAATILVTACSDSFTQDLEELAEERVVFTRRATAAAPIKTQDRPLEKTPFQKDVEHLRNLCSQKKNEALGKAIVAPALGTHNVQKLDELPHEVITDLIMQLESRINEQAQ